MKKQLRVMEYNVLLGFHDVEGRFQPERLRHAQQAVKETNPDILILIEADTGEEQLNYFELFHFQHGVHVAGGHPYMGVAILSHYPVQHIDMIMTELVQHLRTHVTVNETKITVDAIHLHPALDEKQKKQVVMDILQEIPSPYIIAGDFNALSDEDAYTESELIAGLQGHVAHPEAFVTELMQRHTISAIRELGLIDSYRSVNNVPRYTIPTDYLSSDKRSGMRLDYIFCSTDCTIVESRIIVNEDTQQASDHYPLLTTLRV